MTAKTGVFEVCSGFLSENPRPETLAGHGLRTVTGVFGVLFLLLGNFFKNDHRGQMTYQGYQQKTSSDRKKP
jgi:hypothetical protein